MSAMSSRKSRFTAAEALDILMQSDLGEEELDSDSEDDLDSEPDSDFLLEDDIDSDDDGSICIRRGRSQGVDDDSDATASDGDDDERQAAPGPGPEGDAASMAGQSRQGRSESRGRSGRQSQSLPQPQPAQAEAQPAEQGRGRGTSRARGPRRGGSQPARRQPQVQPQPQWTAARGHTPVTHPFRGTVTGKSRINVDTEGFEPINYFSLFLDDDLLQMFMEETNRYAAQWILEHEEQMRKPRARAKQWTPVTKEEMQTFIGQTLLMGLVKKPTLQMYWSRDVLYSTPVFPAVMHRDRYLLILKFWHFNNNANAPDPRDPGRDRLFKLRPLIDHLEKRFQAVYTMSQGVVLDESLVLWKGRLYFRQYLPLKRATFGIKIYILCEVTGYTYKFRIYAGAQDPAHDITNMIPEDARQMGKIDQLVIHMMRALLNLGHTLYVDNYYSSIPLFTYLHDRGTNACGTARKNQVPPVARNAEVAKGESKAWSHDAADLLCVKFHDKKEVYVLTTCHTDDVTAVQSRGRRAVVRNVPNAVIAYNSNMGGVDKVDQVCIVFNSLQ